jgi:prepilin-type N-terminal cleavage/methylation domain-containing protein
MMNHRNSKIVSKESGFTIVELLIATVIFSFVLLIFTSGILQVTGVYYRGINDANTQSVANSVINTISQAIQFDGGTVTPTPAGVATPGNSYFFCVGNEQFSYRPGYELTTGSTNPAVAHLTLHSLIEAPLSGCNKTSSPQPMNGAAVGTELLSPQMRLSNLTVVCQTAASCPTGPDAVDVYKVDVRIAYGYYDLLFSPSKNVNKDAAADATCQAAESGEQFCAVSDQSTIVVKRVQ